MSIVIVSFVTTLYVIDRAVSTVDPGTDRQGGDYRSVIQPTITVEACVSECERDPVCRSWTLVRNGIMRPEMTCLLKNKDRNPPIMHVVHPAKSAAQFAVFLSDAFAIGMGAHLL